MSGGGHIPVGGLITQALNLGALLGILFYILKDKLPILLESRVDVVEKDILLAAKKFEQAQAKKQEWELKVKELHATKEASVEQAKVDALEQGKAILAEADAACEKCKQEMSKDVSSEVLRIKNQIHEEIVTEAVAKAKDFLSKEVKEQDQNRFRGEVVDIFKKGRMDLNLSKGNSEEEQRV